MIKLKRIYSKPDITDGLRILVDRPWPRGVRRSTANVDMWMKNVGPSDELRKWFVRERKFAVFKQRYMRELKTNPAFLDIVELAIANDPVTFLFSAQDEKRNGAAILYDAVLHELKYSTVRKVANTVISR